MYDSLNIGQFGISETNYSGCRDSDQVHRHGPPELYTRRCRKMEAQRSWNKLEHHFVILFQDAQDNETSSFEELYRYLRFGQIQL